MIRLVNVDYHYGIRPVLRGVNLHIRSGELVALMGPNGMGKSTLLKVIAGVVPPLKGYVEVDGKRRRSSPEVEFEIRRKMTFLPDHPWLPQLRTGREYILAVADLYGIEPDHSMAHADRLLDLFELKEKGDSPIQSYSNGQKKKIALCGALIAETPILVLDEPFSGGLDPSGLLALRRVLLHLAERDDVTVVMATPVPEIVEGLAGRIAVIRKGEIAAFDTPDGLRRLSGTDGPLQEVLERLINPETLNRIDRYFERGE